MQLEAAGVTVDDLYNPDFVVGDVPNAAGNLATSPFPTVKVTDASTVARQVLRALLAGTISREMELTREWLKRHPNDKPPKF